MSYFKSYLQNIIVKNENNFEFIGLSLLNQKINFPKIAIELCMLLCMAITNCSYGRTFFTLKHIKDYLRSNIEEDRLTSLSLLAIEIELLNEIYFNDMAIILELRNHTKIHGVCRLI